MYIFAKSTDEGKNYGIILYESVAIFDDMQIQINGKSDCCFHETKNQINIALQM